MKVFQGRLLALVVLLGLGAPAGVIAGVLAGVGHPGLHRDRHHRGRHQPGGVAVDPATDTVYVANQGGNTVSVIDGPPTP